MAHDRSFDNEKYDQFIGDLLEETKNNTLTSSFHNFSAEQVLLLQKQSENMLDNSRFSQKSLNELGINLSNINGLCSLRIASTPHLPVAEGECAFILVQSSPETKPTALYVIDKTQTPAVEREIEFKPPNDISTFLAAIYPRVTNHAYYNIPRLSAEELQKITETTLYRRRGGILKMQGELYAIVKEVAGDQGRAKVLGKGGFGKVKLLQNLHTGELWALKVFDSIKEMRAKSFSDSRILRAVKEIENEAQCLAAMGRGRDIILKKLKYDDLEEQSTCIIQKLCLGKSLKEILKDPLSDKVKMDIALQAFQEIQRLHQLGWLHCDIKPANFMYDEKTAKLEIIDFGLARPVSDQSIKKCGTEGYIAPEMSTSRATEACDVYSLGMLLQVVFKDGPYYFQHFIKDLTSHSPRDRPTMPRAMADLQAIMADSKDNRVALIMAIKEENTGLIIDLLNNAYFNLIMPTASSEHPLFMLASLAHSDDIKSSMMMNIYKAIIRNSKLMESITTESLCEPMGPNKNEGQSTLSVILSSVSGQYFLEELIKNNKYLDQTAIENAICQPITHSYWLTSNLYNLTKSSNKYGIAFLGDLLESASLAKVITANAICQHIIDEEDDEDEDDMGRSPLQQLTTSPEGLVILSKLLKNNPALIQGITAEALTRPLTIAIPYHDYDDEDAEPEYPTPLINLSKSLEGRSILARLAENNPVLADLISKNADRIQLGETADGRALLEMIKNQSAHSSSSSSTGSSSNKHSDLKRKIREISAEENSQSDLEAPVTKRATQSTSLPLFKEAKNDQSKDEDPMNIEKKAGP